jgi:dTDP-4-amino-4,6-dideoxygalactose transaminase
VQEVDRESVFHLLVIRESRRDLLMQSLLAQNIECGVHYPRALSQQSAFAKFGAGTRFPVAEHLAATVISLPFYPELDSQKALLVSTAVNQHWNQK